MRPLRDLVVATSIGRTARTEPVGAKCRGCSRPKRFTTARFHTGRVWHGICFLPLMVMSSRNTRYVIVRRGQRALFAALQKRYAADPSRLVIWDRRSGEDRRTVRLPVSVERRREQRRMPVDAHILTTRGFFVAHVMRSRQPRATPLA
jgi:hypothetical protein